TSPLPTPLHEGAAVDGPQNRLQPLHLGQRLSNPLAVPLHLSRIKSQASEEAVEVGCAVGTQRHVDRDFLHVPGANGRRERPVIACQWFAIRFPLPRPALVRHGRSPPTGARPASSPPDSSTRRPPPRRPVS